MGRKDARIAYLEGRVAGDRHAIEAALDYLDTFASPAPPGLIERLRARLRDDPRPASDEGSLHWLHVVDGDRLVWRLAAELVRLHDAEALRQGAPTWTAPRLEGDPPGHPDLGPVSLPDRPHLMEERRCAYTEPHDAHHWRTGSNESIRTVICPGVPAEEQIGTAATGEPIMMRRAAPDEETLCSECRRAYDPDTRCPDCRPPAQAEPASQPYIEINLNDLVRVQIGNAPRVTLRVEAIRWDHIEGWSIKLDGGGQRPGPDTLVCGYAEPHGAHEWRKSDLSGERAGVIVTYHCPGRGYPAGLVEKLQTLCDEYDLTVIERALYSGEVDHGPEPEESTDTLGACRDEGST